MTPLRGWPLKIVLIAVAAVSLAVLEVAVYQIIHFNPNDYKPDIVAAVKRATGRTLALNGKISLKASLWPTIQATDVTFSNPPGFSRPELATLQGLELQLGLLSLLSSRIAIERLVLLHPNILLETDADGHTNWQITPKASSTARAGAPSQAKSADETRTDVSVASIRIEDGTLGYRDDRTGKVTTLLLPRLDATAESPDSPLRLDVAAAYNGAAFTLTGDTGSLTRLQDPAATKPWPVQVTLTIGSAKIAATGSLTRPLRGKGYDLTVKAVVPNAADVAPLLQGYGTVPPLQEVSFTAKVVDKGDALPEVSALSLRAGVSDLSAQMPGLKLDHLNLSVPGPDQPTKFEGVGTLDNEPLSLTATTGPLAQLLPGPSDAPFPVDITVRAAGAVLFAKGAVSDARAMTGVNLVLAGQIPDLAALSTLARRRLPAIKQMAFQTALTDAPGGFRNGVSMQGLSLTSGEGDLSGDVVIGLRPKVEFTAKLQSNRIDLDALQAAIEKKTAAALPAPAAAVAPPPPSPRPKQSARLFSDQPIPFDLLRAVNADVSLTVADLQTSGADYREIDTHSVLKDGKLAIDPIAADLPGGHLTGRASVDATQPAPPVHVVLNAPGVALKSILDAVHEPSVASGSVEVIADLGGAGDSLHALAGSLDGYLGLAIPHGTIDNRLLGSMLGKVMNTLNALNLVGKGGESELRCFALRMDAQHGVGKIQPLALSSSLLNMTGTGSLNLGEETVSLTLAPEARIAGTGLVIPVDVTGPLRDPAIRVNEVSAAERNAGSVAGAVIGNATPLGIVGGLLGGDKLFGAKTDICPAALAAARGQAAPPPAAKSEDAKSQGSKPPALNPGALLKKLWH